MLQDRTSGRFHRFTPETCFVISLMDGHHSVQQIWDIACEQLHDKALRWAGGLHKLGVARGDAQHTDVVSLNADLLEVATEQDGHWASVRFSGTVRETPGAAPVGFEEVWNLVKPAQGSSGWLLAGIQQMH